MIDRRIGDAEFIKNTIIRMVKENASMRDIAAFLTKSGFPHTRNSIAGKINRLRNNGKIPHSNKSGPNAVPHAPKESDNAKIIRLDKKFIPNRTIKLEHIQAKREKHNTILIKDDTGEGVLFLNARDNQCKWIMDFQRKGQKVCCGKEVHYRSFCKEHYYICYEPVPNRRFKMDPRVDRETQDITKVMYKRFMGIFG